MSDRGAVVVGGSSGVGRALAESLARRGFDLVLGARDLRDLRAVASDLELRFGVSVTPLPVDLQHPDEELAAWVDRCLEIHGGIDTVLVTVGAIDAADDGLADGSLADALVATNFLGVTKIAGRFLAHFDSHGAGTVVLFSSIAAAAPRRRNAIYAASKAALESYGRSMQHRFAGTSVRVQIYALGYIDTTMSRGQRLLLPATAPERVAEHVVTRLGSRHRFGYYPRHWRPIVWVLRRLPWPIYRRLAF